MRRLWGVHSAPGPGKKAADNEAPVPVTPVRVPGLSSLPHESGQCRAPARPKALHEGTPCTKQTFSAVECSAVTHQPSAIDCVLAGVEHLNAYPLACPTCCRCSQTRAAMLSLCAAALLLFRWQLSACCPTEARCTRCLPLHLTEVPRLFSLQSPKSAV